MKIFRGNHVFIVEQGRYRTGIVVEVVGAFVLLYGATWAWTHTVRFAGSTRARMEARRDACTHPKTKALTSRRRRICLHCMRLLPPQ